MVHLLKGQTVQQLLTLQCTWSKGSTASCSVKATYQSCDVQHCRRQVRQPTSAKVVHCKVCRGLEKNQVQENENEKSLAGCKQLLQQNKMKTVISYYYQFN